MNQERSDVAIAAFANPQQTRFSARAVLPWHQPQRGSQWSPVLELAPVPKAGDDGGGRLGANAFELADPLTSGTALILARDAGIVTGDARIQGHELFLEFAQERAKVCRKPVLAVFEDLG